VGVHPLPSPAGANFSNMMECTYAMQKAAVATLRVLCGYNTHSPHHHISWRFPVRTCNDDLQVLVCFFFFLLAVLSIGPTLVNFLNGGHIGELQLLQENFFFFSMGLGVEMNTLRPIYTKI
jgi:hypothetical protein